MVSQLKKSRNNSAESQELLNQVLAFSKSKRPELIYADLQGCSMKYGRVMIYSRFQQIDALIPQMAAFFPDDECPFEYISISVRTIFGGEWKSYDRRSLNENINKD